MLTTAMEALDQLLADVLPPGVAVERIPGEHPSGIEDRWRVKTVDLDDGRWHVEVIPMLVNYRLHTVRADTDDPYEWSDRFWCFEGRGFATLLRAVLAAHEWDGAHTSEPVGWIKSWDQRYHGTGPCRPGPRTPGDPR